MSHFPAHPAFTVTLRGPRPRPDDLEEGSNNGSQAESADIPVAREATVFYAFYATILCSSGRFLSRVRRCVVICFASVYHNIFLLRTPSTPSCSYRLTEFMKTEGNPRNEDFSRSFKRFIDAQVEWYSRGARECRVCVRLCIVCMALSFSTSGTSYVVLMVLWFTVCVSAAIFHALSYKMKKHLLAIRDESQLALNFHIASIQNASSPFISTPALLAVPHAWKAWTYACGIASFILFIWHSAASGTLPIIVSFFLQRLFRWPAYDAQALEPPQLVDPQAVWVPVAARYAVVALPALGAVHGVLVCLQFSGLGYPARNEHPERQSRREAGSQSRSSSRDATQPEHEERDSGVDAQQEMQHNQANASPAAQSLRRKPSGRGTMSGDDTV